MGTPALFRNSRSSASWLMIFRRGSPGLPKLNSLRKLQLTLSLKSIPERTRRASVATAQKENRVSISPAGRDKKIKSRHFKNSDVY